MEKKDFEYYHETKLIEALTSIIDEREVEMQTIDYLASTLKFLSFNSINKDAWKELLQLMNNNLEQLKETDFLIKYLQQLSEEIQEKEKKFEILNAILTTYFRQNQFDKALETCNQQIDLVYDTNLYDLQAEVYRNKGTIYHVSGQLDEGEKWYNKAYNLNQEISEYQIKDQNVYALANLHQHYTGEFDKALSFYSEGKELAVEEDNHGREAFYLDHMGMAEYCRTNFQTAIEYHKLASQKLESQDRSINVLFNHVQMGMALSKVKEFEELLRVLEDVLDLKKANTDAYSNAWYLLLLSDVVKNIPKFDIEKFKDVLKVPIEEEALIKEAKSLAEATKYVPAIVYANIYLARYCIQESPEQAMSLLSEAKHIAITNNRHRETNALIAEVEMIGLDYDTL